MVVLKSADSRQPFTLSLSDIKRHKRESVNHQNRSVDLNPSNYTSEKGITEVLLFIFSLDQTGASHILIPCYCHYKEGELTLLQSIIFASDVLKCLLLFIAPQLNNYFKH